MIGDTLTLLAEKGDVGHIALFLWAFAASWVALILLRDLVDTANRFEAFVIAIARLNARLEPQWHGSRAPGQARDAALADGPLEPAPIAFRSFMRVVSDTRQPSPRSPMRLASGTRASVR